MQFLFIRYVIVNNNYKKKIDPCLWDVVEYLGANVKEKHFYYHFIESLDDLSLREVRLFDTNNHCVLAAGVHYKTHIEKH